MGKQLVEWLTDKFGDELKSRFAMPALVAATLTVLLTWATVKGEYFSALLSLLTVAPADLTAEDAGLSKLPLYVFVGAVLGSLLGYKLVRLLARSYFRFICQLPAHRAKLEQMKKDMQGTRTVSTQRFMDELRTAQDELERRRSSVRSIVQAYEWLAMSGLAIVAISFVGNALDAGVGSCLLIASLGVLYRSVGVFLAKVTPWHAKVEALTLASPEAAPSTSP